MLLLMRVYTMADLQKRSPAELAKDLDAIWDDVLAIEHPQPVKLSTKPAEPAEPAGPKLLNKIPAGDPAPTRNPPTSRWPLSTSARLKPALGTSQHEFGRCQLDQVFPARSKTVAYHNAVVGSNADALVEQAIAEGADIVFTTSPKLVGAALRAALRHPETRILNCSVDMPYTSIRTYYTRVYEAKLSAAPLPAPWPAATGSAIWPSHRTSAPRPTLTPLRSARGW